jgi:hypothetical protein
MFSAFLPLLQQLYVQVGFLWFAWLAAFLSIPIFYAFLFHVLDLLNAAMKRKTWSSIYI